ncbi:MAG TPA: hypothetical protein PKC18_18940 [Lacipirellulaceae bacterium]|nr:hypothetical protein [Lacipirellulaceae bacterium]HMP07029.1 hypothetical protein [Lacipirellulaceae bacterium]
MDGATYQATVVNGQILLPQSVQLPENATVFVVVPSASPEPTARVASPRLVRPEQSVDFQLDVKDVDDAGV